MVLIKEYRVVLPCSVEEYQVGQLFSVAEASKNETGGGEGIEVLKNEPYEKDGEKGQYTHKIYHLKSKVPGFVRLLAPEGALVFHEKAWNAYPYCRTIVTNEYMKDNFFIKIETWHKPDLGMQENVHKLDSPTWKNVTVVPIDIADRSQVAHADYKEDEDPAIFKSVKTGRGPLGPNWKKELNSNPECPRMCAYKLVTVKFKWWGLQTKVENFIHEQEKRIFTNFHRQLFCWIDKWVELNMDDIRRMEAETQRELDESGSFWPYKENKGGIWAGPAKVGQSQTFLARYQHAEFLRFAFSHLAQLSMCFQFSLGVSKQLRKKGDVRGTSAADE